MMQYISAFDGYRSSTTGKTTGTNNQECYVYQYSYSYSSMESFDGYAITWVPRQRTGRVFFYPNCSTMQSPLDYREEIDIIVADNREFNDNNPNMKIFNSDRITNPQQREAIVDVMILYDQEHPSDPAWGRTKDSLLNEWEIHNFGAAFGYQAAIDTDFDHNEEGFTLIDYVKKFLKN